MALTPELKQIKKKYGEKFMQMCRSKFPTILAHEGQLLEILQSTISDTSETLVEDIQRHQLEKEFIDYIYSEFEEQTKEPVVINKTPYELLEEAGYDLVECTSEKEIQSYKKYYASGEQLCTFNGDRLDECIVFWAVKKNVKDIKREDFDNPERDDEYGTSVMSIQFTRAGKSRVSIKNRYNHTVMHPDATLDNDLDKIAPGLTYSFKTLLQERGLDFAGGTSEFRIPGYIQANDGIFYKYNACIGNTYYCPDNIVIESRVPRKLENPEKQILIDCFILDTENKTIRMFDENEKDSFTDTFVNIQKIEIKKDKETGDGRKHITIYKEVQEEPIIITIDKDDRIIGYQNSDLQQVGDNFLSHSIGIETLDVPKLERAGDDFLTWSRSLKSLNISSLIEVGDRALLGAQSIKEISAPKLKKAGGEFCYNANSLKSLDAPELVEISDSALSCANSLQEINASKLEKVGDYFCSNNSFHSLDLPSLKKAGEDFCAYSSELRHIKLPQLRMVGGFFCMDAPKLSSVNLPHLRKAGAYFLEQLGEKIGTGEAELTEFNAPKISRLQWFFSENRHMFFALGKFKKQQKISRKDIALLDKENTLIPQEVEEAKQQVEPDVVSMQENIKENDKEII